MWLVLVILMLYHLVEITSTVIVPMYTGKVHPYVPPEDEVMFFMYHRSNVSYEYQIFIGNETSLDYAPFDPELPTAVLVHGWTHGRNVPYMVELRESMAKTGYWNVIILDWSLLGHCIYIEARVHTAVVSKQLKQLLLFLGEYRGVAMDSVHIIGHSMGAQIAAGGGHLVFKESEQKVGRITGLDPAAPLYEWPHLESMDEVLDVSDALFVDVIHTNGRHLGMMIPAGHVDFYPNGGQKQPGCSLWICSHMRSVEFFVASLVKPDLFKAYPYDEYQRHLAGDSPPPKTYPMGIAVYPDMPPGIYYLETDNEFMKYLTSKTSILDSFL